MASIRQQLSMFGIPIRKLQGLIRKRPAHIIPPRIIEREYVSFLNSLVSEWRKLYLSVIDPQLERLAAQAYILKPSSSVGVKTDAWPDELNIILSSYNISVQGTLKPVSKLTRDIAEKTSQYNLKQWQKVVKSVFTIPLFVNEPWLSDQLKSFSSQNVQLITKLSQDTYTDIQRIIEDGFQRGKRVSTIRGEILGTKIKKGRFKKTRTRAILISRDQVNKLNGQLTQLRQGEIGIDYYTWRTSIDERVRISHKAMEGKICRWDDATLYKNSLSDAHWLRRGSIGGVTQHPGQDYQCRCWPEPIFSTII